MAEKGAICKMTLRRTVRRLPENRITDRADIRAFDWMGHRFQPELSTKNRDVFLKVGKVSARGQPRALESFHSSPSSISAIRLAGRMLTAISSSPSRTICPTNFSIG